MQYPRLHSKRCRYFQITTNTSSIGCLFFCLLLESTYGFSCLRFSSYAHAVGFSACQLLSVPSFLPLSLPISFRGGFFSCFSLPTPTPWAFPLACFSPRPLFSPQPIDKLPEWVFSLAFLFLRPRRGFFCLLISLRTHFSPQHTSTCFCFVFSACQLSHHTHATQKTTAYLTIHGGSKLLFTIYFRK